MSAWDQGDRQSYCSKFRIIFLHSCVLSYCGPFDVDRSIKRVMDLELKAGRCHGPMWFMANYGAERKLPLDDFDLQLEIIL